MGVCQSNDEPITSPRVGTSRPEWLVRGGKGFPKDSRFLQTSSPDPAWSPQEERQLQELESASGIFFEIEAKQRTICISALVGAGFTCSCPVDVDVCPVDTDGSMWTQSSKKVCSSATLGSRVSTRVPLDPVVKIEAGTRWAFYVHPSTDHLSPDAPGAAPGAIAVSPATLAAGPVAANEDLSVVSGSMLVGEVFPAHIAAKDPAKRFAAIAGGVEYRIYDGAMLDEVWEWADTDKDGFLNHEEISRLLETTGGDPVDLDQYSEICEVLGADSAAGVAKLQFELFYANGHADIEDAHEFIKASAISTEL